MMRNIERAVLALSIIFVATSSATASQVLANASDFLQTGMASDRFKGNEFFMVVGEVHLYQYDRLSGTLEPTDQTVEIAAVVQAEKDTGKILRIATDGSRQVLVDLRGGISVIDVQPYPHWRDAVQAMRDAIIKLTPTRGLRPATRVPPLLSRLTLGRGGLGTRIVTGGDKHARAGGLLTVRGFERFSRSETLSPRLWISETSAYLRNDRTMFVFSCFPKL